METSTCPCGSAKDLESCCLPVIKEQRPALTAEELLRARYSAFAIGEIDFIFTSHHSKTRGELKREEIEDWSRNSEWHGLEVVDRNGGQAADEQGTLTFCARFSDKKSGGEPQEHWEQSLFEKENGHWRFVDARGLKQGPYQREEPKVGRNDPCPCGSKQKFKKCCGK
ncbi:MAG: hypothetical protein A2070_10970 [Bdellovibrionales bacterium GWC1_52_8]|nr:MAG: hypothetical protein A2Z97_01445 [Bdellovibrionales bacterium GWB1_52_6]OFZ04997.1 MAG: hypothetical protein A2X97_00155 [Bdellovibrionales bacterium GWA1_52_35]OFZ40307.1 MAG: hypothetical protein A2070_10970 [Bdellovibrionales bacterium GWC1_52_8]HCM41227.1 hypothetical protein [Bdellovibrionales bacterium]